MRKPYQRHQSPTPFSRGAYQERWREDDRLIPVGEALARIGADNDAGALPKRCMVAGEHAWLVDIVCMATPVSDPITALDAEGSLLVVERGSSL